MSSTSTSAGELTGRDLPAGHSREHVVDNIVRIYVGAVALGGLLMTVFAVGRAHNLDLEALAVFCAAAAAAEFLKLVTTDDAPVAISLSLAVVLAAAVPLGPAGATLAGVSAGLAAGLLRRPRPALRKTSFNTGLFALAGGSAAFAYQWVMGSASNSHTLGVNNIAASMAALAAYFVVAWPLLMGIVHLTTGKPLRRIWFDDFRWMPVHIAVSAVIGFTLGTAYLLFGWVGTIVYMTPLLAVREAMRQYTTRVRSQIEELRTAQAEATEANRELQRVNKELDATNEGLLKTLASVIDARDIYLYGHSVQASRYAKEVAVRLGLPAVEIKNAEYGALLHDIGKIGVPEAILNKPARLTEDEYREIQTHCEIGFELLSNLPLFEAIAEVVRCHHEHYNGSGYPRGLKGEEIPVAARIVSVVEATEAMVSDRPYRKGMSPDEVLQELARGAGQQWDPRVVEIFSGLLSQDRKHLVMRNSALEVALSRTPINELVTDEADVDAPTLQGVSATFRNAGQPIFILDSDYRVVSINPAAERLTGWSDYQLQGKSWSGLCLSQEMRNGVSPTFGTTRNVVMAKRDRGSVDLEVTGSPLHTNSATYWLVMAHDVSHRVRRESDLRRKAQTDFLTQLANREAFDGRVEEMMRAGARPLAIALLDLDNLKIVNDSFGHGAGDEALRTLAFSITCQLRQNDVAARIGGDEFAIMMLGSSRENADRLLSRINATLADASSSMPYPVSFAAGVAEWDGREHLGELMQRADADMYARKHEGRDPSIITLPVQQHA